MLLILISPKSDATQILFLKSCIFFKQSGFLHKEVIVLRLPDCGVRKYCIFCLLQLKIMFFKIFHLLGFILVSGLI